jgi:hypothetical protein
MARKLLFQRIRWFRLSFVLLLMNLLCSLSGRRIHLVSSLQLSGSVSLSSKYSSTTGGCYSTIRATSFLSTTAQVFIQHVLYQTAEQPPLSYFSNTRFVTIMMGKGDGKQKRKKQDTSPSSSPPAPVPQTPAAPRVSNGINVPIRRQIAYGKLNKHFRETGSTSFRQSTNKKTVRTKYRRSWGTLLYLAFLENR